MYKKREIKKVIIDEILYYYYMYENLDETSCWKLIETSREDKKNLKMLYKNGKYADIIKDMMEHRGKSSKGV